MWSSLRIGEDFWNVGKVSCNLEGAYGLISSYELAFRMQASVPKSMDIQGESAATLEAYGFNDAETRNFGTQCLLARLRAVAGVRFIELNMNGWDQHNQLKPKIESNAKAID